MTTLDKPPPLPGVSTLRPPRNRISRRAIACWAVTAAWGWLFVFGMTLLPMLFVHNYPSWAHTGVRVLAGVAVVHLAVMPAWRYRVHRWEISDEAVYVRVGWLNQSWHIVPISRVQSVDTYFGAADRMFKIGNVSVGTAGSGLSIYGLDKELVLRVAHELTEKANVTPEDAT